MRVPVSKNPDLVAVKHRKVPVRDDHPRKAKNPDLVAVKNAQALDDLGVKRQKAAVRVDHPQRLKSEDPRKAKKDENHLKYRLVEQRETHPGIVG